MFRHSTRRRGDSPARKCQPALDDVITAAILTRRRAAAQKFCAGARRLAWAPDSGRTSGGEDRNILFATDSPRISGYALTYARHGSPAMQHDSHFSRESRIPHPTISTAIRSGEYPALEANAITKVHEF